MKEKGRISILFSMLIINFIGINKTNEIFLNTAFIKLITATLNWIIYLLTVNKYKSTPKMIPKNIYNRISPIIKRKNEVQS